MSQRFEQHVLLLEGFRASIGNVIGDNFYQTWSVFAHVPVTVCSVRLINTRIYAGSLDWQANFLFLASLVTFFIIPYHVPRFIQFIWGYQAHDEIADLLNISQKDEAADLAKVGLPVRAGKKSADCLPDGEIRNIMQSYNI